jgi:hypothetical protein
MSRKGTPKRRRCLIAMPSPHFVGQAFLRAAYALKASWKRTLQRDTARSITLRAVSSFDEGTAAVPSLAEPDATERVPPGVF